VREKWKRVPVFGDISIVSIDSSKLQIQAERHVPSPKAVSQAGPSPPLPLHWVLGWRLLFRNVTPIEASSFGLMVDGGAAISLRKALRVFFVIVP
jgi:hypothetical protein